MRTVNTQTDDQVAYIEGNLRVTHRTKDGQFDGIYIDDELFGHTIRVDHDQAIQIVEALTALTMPAIPKSNTEPSDCDPSLGCTFADPSTIGHCWRQGARSIGYGYALCEVHDTNENVQSILDHKVA